jgi:Flp pilus assembly protein TadD
LLYAQGWAFGQSPAEAEGHCAQLFESVEASPDPNWRPAARACRRAYRLASASGEEAVDLLERSLAAHQAAGDLERAERFARELVSRAPGKASSYLKLGEVLHQQRKIEEALWAYVRATELDRSDAMARFRRGQAQFGLGRFSLALEDLRTAARLDPGLTEWAPYHQELATVLFELGRVEEALAAYRQVTRLLPDWADGWGNLGMYYFSLKRYDEAVAAYERAVQIDPEFFDTRPDQRERWQQALRAAL